MVCGPSSWFSVVRRRVCGPCDGDVDVEVVDDVVDDGPSISVVTIGLVVVIVGVVVVVDAVD